MASTSFTASGLEFVPNNYAAPLANENAPEAFHLIQNFLAKSDIGHALTAPLKLSASQITSFWQTGTYDNGGETGSPSIIFDYQGQEYVVTPDTVRDALDFEGFNSYTIAVGDDLLLRMMREIGYSGSLVKVGQLKRPFLRKEWSFFFDCITRAFGKKCTIWDAIPTESLQIGYSLLFGNNLDFVRIVLTNIGEKMQENRNVVYFSRFCQFLFTFCCHDVEILEDDVILSFKLHKRVFSDLINIDVKKGDVGVLLLPERVQQFQDNSQQSNAEAGPSVVHQQRSQKMKKRVVKSPRVQVNVDSTANAEAGKSRIPRIKKRANRPHSSDEEEIETLQQRKRRLVAAYLFGASNVSAKAVPEENVTANRVDDTVEEAFENAEAAPMPEMVSADIEAPTSKDDVVEEAAAYSDSRVSENEDIEMDFFIHNENLEAHPSISVCDTEDVAADQATLVIEDSVGSHTEVLSVNNANSEKALQQAVVEVVTREAEVFAQANSDIPETVAEKVIDEAAQLHNELTAENVPTANEADIDEEAENDAEGSHSHPSIQVSLSDGVNTDEAREVNRETAEYYQNMYYNRWADADCVFSAQRAADFLSDSVKHISNSDVLTSLKATVVQVKALHNRFDETQTVVTNLRNEVGIRDLTLKTDRSYYSAMSKQQAKDSDELKKWLGKVEENQTAMSVQLTSISIALELLTSVLLSDDVKKGESVPNDKCKDTQTLRRRDDSADGGSKETERNLISAQGQRRSRLNSDSQSIY
ncbi:hypothetical protein POM88_029026 [Heracleum sosnowskyi]|uniref:Uncharacterized protein n=1 Tax=Heracleum sosnowskyi TaxID=360622 RepID=A0AAD8HTY8_9APIA|nr:hypothetical protein POM88_029026 [Heracleum sosnowskyi]